MHLFIDVYMPVCCSFTTYSVIHVRISMYIHTYVYVSYTRVHEGGKTREKQTLQMLDFARKKLNVSLRNSLKATIISTGGYMNI